MGEEYVTICVACTKGVTKENMQYVNGMVFHPECYQKHGKDFHVVDTEVAKNAARIKVDLVQLKNLKIRNKSPSKAKPKAKKAKPKKRRVKKTKKVKRRKPTKTRKAKKKTATKKSRKGSKKKSRKRARSSKKRTQKRR